MTKLELRESIKQEARVKTSTELDDFIDSLIFEITRDYCNKSRYDETLIIDAVIVAIDATGEYDLPADFQNLQELRFGVGPSATYWWTILPRNTVSRRRSITGYPANYTIAGNKIHLYPYDCLLSTDSILISYYSDLMIAFSAAADSADFPIPRLESTVKKETVARIQRFHLDFPSADRTSKDAGSSFVAARS